MSYGIDWDDDFDDRVKTYCPLCRGAYMPAWSGNEAYFGHAPDCEARILSTRTLLRLYYSATAVRAEIERQRPAGSS
ncbi:hypothetical protein ACH4VX_24740 [Streptomyces sp. NPDC020731]|uniref:hypothetical protein n=1 Tax=Streptomyces sp. NPDC020731 TaxID=3365085 RepID=UPI0037B1356A